MMTKRCAILQSSYIPWKGYFDIISSVDEFILYDDVQFTKRDWRTRNKIKTPNGSMWLSIPVKTKGQYTQKISEVEVLDNKWTGVHWETIRHNYRAAKYFNDFSGMFEEVYHQCQFLVRLSDINELFIKTICQFLNIQTKITRSEDYGFAELRKTQRLVALCKAAEATFYLSGPSAKDYIEEDQFDCEKIVLRYKEYAGYKEYTQLYNEFDHYVSVIDLIFNEGPRAIDFIKLGE